MKYYPLREPISRIIIDSPNNVMTDVAVYFSDNLPAGLLTARQSLVVDFLTSCCFSQLEICSIEDGIITWHGDYNKSQLLSENGEIVIKSDLDHRDE